MRQRALAEHLLGVLTGKLDLVVRAGRLAPLPLPRAAAAGPAVDAARAPPRRARGRAEPDRARTR